MSNELKLARARQRLKNINMRERAKLPELEPSEYRGPIEVSKSTQSEEILSKNELSKLLNSIIRDSEQVDNIMNDMSIVNDESAPLLVENFDEIVKGLKKTYKSGVAFPQLKGFIKRYSEKLLKQVTPDQNITYQTGPSEANMESYRKAVEEVNNLRSLIARGDLLTRGFVNEQAKKLLDKLVESNAELLANKQEIQRLQQLISNGVLIPSAVVNQREQRLLDDFSNRDAEQIASLVESTIESGSDIPIEITDRELQKIALYKDYTINEVKPNIKSITTEQRDEMTNRLKTILTETLGPNMAPSIQTIINEFKRGQKGPIKRLTTDLMLNRPTKLADIIADSAPLVTKWRNDKIAELLRDPEYQRNPQNIKPDVERMSKEMFGYGIGSKKKRC